MKIKNRVGFYTFTIMTVAVLTAALLWAYLYMRGKIPDTLRIFSGQEQNLTFDIPVSGTVYNADQEAVMEFPVTDQVTLFARESQSYQMRLKLFGVVPIRDVEVRVTGERTLIPVGMPVGIYMKAKSAMVIGVGEFIGEDGMKYAPSRYLLQEGDYILQVNGQEIGGKKDLIRLIEGSEGIPMNLLVERDGEQFPMQVQPRTDINGVYKLGIWIRDNAQGVGTMTFMETNGDFGALGHGINDVDTGLLMELQYGELYHTDIIGIRRGSAGTPGELTGLISYQESNHIGSIASNTKKGIFGSLYEGFVEDLRPYSDFLTETPVGTKQEIETGKATILTGVDGSIREYEINIEKVNYNSGTESREIELKVTDPKLLSRTGGIIQGMSGSPILQNGKIIGAVTHVLVGDPTKGYGIFIEEMLEE